MDSNGGKTENTQFDLVCIGYKCKRRKLSVLWRPVEVDQ